MVCWCGVVWLVGFGRASGGGCIGRQLLGLAIQRCGVVRVCVCVCVSYSDSSFYLYASEPCDILPLGGLYMRLLPLGDSHLNMVAEQLLQVYNQKLLHRPSAVAMLIFSGFSD